MVAATPEHVDQVEKTRHQHRRRTPVVNASQPGPERHSCHDIDNAVVRGDRVRVVVLVQQDTGNHEYCQPDERETSEHVGQLVPDRRDAILERA